MNNLEYIGLSIWLLHQSKPGRPFIKGLEDRLNTMMNKFKCKPNNWSIIRLQQVTNMQGANLWGTNNEN